MGIPTAYPRTRSPSPIDSAIEIAALEAAFGKFEVSAVGKDQQGREYVPLTMQTTEACAVKNDIFNMVITNSLFSELLRQVIEQSGSDKTSLQVAEAMLKGIDTLNDAALKAKFEGVVKALRSEVSYPQYRPEDEAKAKLRGELSDSDEDIFFFDQTFRAKMRSEVPQEEKRVTEEQTYEDLYTKDFLFPMEGVKAVVGPTLEELD